MEEEGNIAAAAPAVAMLGDQEGLMRQCHSSRKLVV